MMLCLDAYWLLFSADVPAPPAPEPVIIPTPGVKDGEAFRINLADFERKPQRHVPHIGKCPDCQ